MFKILYRTFMIINPVIIIYLLSCFNFWTFNLWNVFEAMKINQRGLLVIFHLAAYIVIFSFQRFMFDRYEYDNKLF